MISIIEYRTEWPLEFRQVGRLLRTALGDLAVRIDHIGSTSVPGLCAKDILDIQVSVRALTLDVAGKVSELGFRAPPGVWVDHRPPGAIGPDEDWQKMLFSEPVNERRVNLHVRVIDRPNQRYPLLFRDYLIAYPQAAAAYGELKRRLAAGLRNSSDYPVVKDPAVDLIYLAASSWGKLVAWEPNESNA
jgi:GrpB-like predicted nucleotidyltransferase (UPF0157 family)